MYVMYLLNARLVLSPRNDQPEVSKLPCLNHHTGANQPVNALPFYAERRARKLQLPLSVSKWCSYQGLILGLLNPK